MINMKKLALGLGALAAFSMASAADLNVDSVKAPVQLTAAQMDQVVAGQDVYPGYGVFTAMTTMNSQAYHAEMGVTNSWDRTGKCTAMGTYTASGATFCIPG